MGFGFPTSLMRPMFERLAWDPPRIMTTAFQFCYANPAWMKALVGWVGIDQVCEENPLYGRFLERFEKHWGYAPHHPNTVPVLAYDSARVFTEAIRRADGVLTGPGHEGGAGAHPLRAERHRRPAHPHRRRARRPQPLPRRLAPLPPRRRGGRQGMDRRSKALWSQPV